MSFLARTKCAGLNICDSFTADELKENKVIPALQPVDKLLDIFPKVVIDVSERKKLLNGVLVNYIGAEQSPLRVYCGKEFIGLGGIKNSRLKINTLLTDR